MEMTAVEKIKYSPTFYTDFKIRGGNVNASGNCLRVNVSQYAINDVALIANI